MKSLVDTGIIINMNIELMEFLTMAHEAGWLWADGKKPYENPGTHPDNLYIDAHDGFGMGTRGNPSCPSNLISLSEFKRKQIQPASFLKVVK